MTLSAQKKAFGFTLIELLVTIAIVSILASIGLVVYSSAQRTARISKRVQDLQAIRTALEIYKTSVGKYPQSPAETCVDALSGTNNLAPSYMPSVPKDPFVGACYKYISDDAGNEYKIRTDDRSVLPDTEMTSDDFKTQPNMIDPKRDSDPESNCVIESADKVSAWAIYTVGGCNF